MPKEHAPRTDWKTFRQLAPDAYDSVVALNKIAEQNGLDKQLLELVKLRASPISAEFSEKELAYLSTAIAAINVWNRFGAPYRWAPPARQQPPQAKAS